MEHPIYVEHSSLYPGPMLSSFFKKVSQGTNLWPLRLVEIAKPSALDYVNNL